MKSIIPIAIISIFALSACETTNVAEEPVEPAAAEGEVLDCVSDDPENPQCGTGGTHGPGPILRGDADGIPNSTTGDGGTDGPGPIIDN